VAEFCKEVIKELLRVASCVFDRLGVKAFTELPRVMLVVPRCSSDCCSTELYIGGFKPNLRGHDIRRKCIAADPECDAYLVQFLLRHGFSPRLETNGIRGDLFLCL
jgi:hypothetical protein